MTETLSTERRTQGPSLPVRAAVAVAVAVLANAALVAASDVVGVVPDFRALTFPPVVLLSAVGAVGAAVTYRLLGRVVDDVDRTFRRVVVAVLVLSFVPDVTLLAVDDAATVPGVVLLMVMHVVVAAAAVWTLVYWGREQ